MNSAPKRQSFTRKEWQLIESLDTPARVQRFFSLMPYNWEKNGGTMRSFREVIKRDQAHCLEAAVGAAVILEQHGYPPLLLDIESFDLLDHVIFVFQQDGLWGSIARSRDKGLHGRKPLFRSLRDLTWSYFEPYVDFSGRIKGYGLANLYELGNYDWRFAPKNMWAVERFLIDIPHRRIRVPQKRIRLMRARYKEYLARTGKKPLFYRGREKWTEIPREFL